MTSSIISPVTTTNRTSMFNAALPYGVATLAVGGLGAILAATAVAKVAAVIGVIIAVIGAYGFMGVLATALVSKNIDQFEANVGQGMVTAAATALANVISQVAHLVLIRLIFRDDQR